MSDSLTISEACSLTGKSESTIKRMVREIVAEAEHPDRGLIEPSHEELKKLRAAGEPYVWKLAEELLLRRFPPKSSQDADVPDDAPSQPATSSLASILQEQLRSKDGQLRTLEKQLDRKDEQIANLNERQRESNILMKTLQERLAIAAPIEEDPPKKEQAKMRKVPAWLSKWMGQ